MGKHDLKFKGDLNDLNLFTEKDKRNNFLNLSC